MSERIRAIWLPIMSGVLLFAAFPPLDWGLPAFVALTPLFAALHRCRPLQGFRRTMLFGLVFWSLIFWWLVPFVNRWTSPGLGLVPWLLLSTALALYSGLFGFLAALLLARRPSLAVLTLPAAWTLIEYARSYWPLGGLPWTLLGTALYRWPPLIQPASVGGVWLLTFIVALVNAFIASPRTVRPIQLAAGAGFIVVIYLASFLTAGNHSPATLDLGMIQTGVDEARIANAAYRAQVRETTLRAVENLPPSPETRPMLIILPESVSPVDPIEDPTWAAELQRAHSGPSWLLFGGHHLERGKELNLAVLVGLKPPDGAPAGTISDWYAKTRLVPFGEYVPWRDRLPFLNDFNVLPFDVAQGKEVRPLRADGLCVGTPICFESFYPDMSRSMARQGAQLIAYLINDDWYNQTTRRQHAMVAPIRAVETRLPVVRCTPTGITMVVSSTGERNEAPPGGEATLIAQVHLPIEGRRSTYVRFGDWVILACAAICVMVFFGRNRNAQVKLASAREG